VLQTAESLRKSENRLQRAVSGSPDGLWDWDLTTNNVWVSTRLKEQIGYADHDPYDTYEVWESSLHPEDKPMVLEKIRRHLEENQVYDAEFRLRAKDGSYRWIRSRGVVSRDEAGKPVRMCGSHQDITKRKLTEEALASSIHRYETLVNSIDGVVWEADPATFQFTFVSRQAEPLLGYPLEQWITEPTFWRDHIHPDDRDETVACCMDATRNKKDHNFEYRMIAADGRVVWVQDLVKLDIKNSEVCNIRGLIIDVTERKKIEAYLQKQSTAIGSAMEGIAILDSEGRYLYMNQAHATVHGYDHPGELIGKTWECLYRAGDIEAIENQVFSTFAKDGRWHGELLGKKRDDSLFDVEVSLTRLDGGGMACVCRDVTERKRSETALRESKALLNQKNADLEHFIFSISHDLKSPVITILGYAGHMQNHLAQGCTDELPDFTRRVLNAGQRMQNLIDGLLNLSSMGREIDELESIDVRALLCEIKQDLVTRFPHASAVTVDIPPDVSVLYADRNRLRQLFENLLTNALKYGSGAENPVVQVGAKLEDSAPWFFVRDNGSGIAREHHERIFNIFQRVHRGGDGAGVGLAIVKRIAEIYGGTARVESEPDQGATFWVSLPSTNAAVEKGHVVMGVMRSS
jgi:PAS domain S-box-containing protein